MQQKQTSYYAVAKGNLPGIYMNWSDCKAQVDNFKNPIFRKFNCKQEAELFIQTKGNYSSFTKEITTCELKQNVARQCPITVNNTEKPHLGGKDGHNNVIAIQHHPMMEQETITAYTIKDPNDEYIEDFLFKVGISPKDCLFVFTDGGCRKNGYSGAIAGIGIYFNENDPRNKSIQVKGKSTNNIAELQAFIELYPIIQQYLVQEHETGIISTAQVWPSNVLKDPIATKDSYSVIKQIVIVSDSVYAIRCVTEYGEKCEQDQWTNPIPNLDLVKRAYSLYKNYTNVYFAHIMAHTKGNGKYSKGNQNADKLANQAMITANLDQQSNNGQQSKD